MISGESARSFQTVGVEATPVGLTLPSDWTPVRATVTLETGQIRYRYDGTAPSATVGHVMDVGDGFTIEGTSNITRFSAIRTGGTSGVLSVTLEAQ